ncbi:unnamed protein product [Ixodes pacificus]
MEATHTHLCVAVTAVHVQARRGIPNISRQTLSRLKLNMTTCTKPLSRCSHSIQKTRRWLCLRNNCLRTHITFELSESSTFELSGFALYICILQTFLQNVLRQMLQTRHNRKKAMPQTVPGVYFVECITRGTSALRTSNKNRQKHILERTTNNCIALPKKKRGSSRNTHISALYKNTCRFMYTHTVRRTDALAEESHRGSTSVENARGISKFLFPSSYPRSSTRILLKVKK